MTGGGGGSFSVTPEMLLRAYAIGIFPMAEAADDPTIHWVDPERRGVILPGGFHAPRSLLKTVRQGRFDMRVDTAFAEVVEECAAPAPGRQETWINAPIRALYLSLFRMGRAHSVETWRDGRLVGGLYGVSLGGAFFGESMFSRETDASKVALVHLWARLMAGGYRLLDTQFLTEHLTRFGAIEIGRQRYHALLADALEADASFHSAAGGTSESERQSTSHTS